MSSRLAHSRSNGKRRSGIPVKDENKDTEARPQKGPAGQIRPSLPEQHVLQSSALSLIKRAQTITVNSAVLSPQQDDLGWLSHLALDDICYEQAKRGADEKAISHVVPETSRVPAFTAGSYALEQRFVSSSLRSYKHEAHAGGCSVSSTVAQDIRRQRSVAQDATTLFSGVACNEIPCHGVIKGSFSGTSIIRTSTIIEVV